MRALRAGAVTHASVLALRPHTEITAMRYVNVPIMGRVMLLLVLVHVQMDLQDLYARRCVQSMSLVHVDVFVNMEENVDCKEVATVLRDGPAKFVLINVQRVGGVRNANRLANVPMVVAVIM